jgi:hypothetical protein
MNKKRAPIKINKNYNNTYARRVDDVCVGDLLHYCPIDIEEKYHDIGLIYNVIDSELDILYRNNIKKYCIYWSRSCMFDVFSQTTLGYKLSQICQGKNILILVKNKRNG